MIYPTTLKFIKRGSVSTKFSVSLLVIFVSLILIFSIRNNALELFDNTANITTDLNITDNITSDTNIAGVENNLSNETLINISSNSTSENLTENIVSNYNEFVLQDNTPISSGRIINSRTEIYNSGDGNSNAIIYSGDIFKNYNGRWYDLSSFANISYSSGNINIKYDKYSLIITPYIIQNKNKAILSDLSSTVKDRTKFITRANKERNLFKFGVNFTNDDNFDEVGFDYSSNAVITQEDNRLFMNDILEIDFNDIINSNYTIDISSNSIKIKNIKNGFNDLDPIIRFNSSSKDGSCSGTSCNSNNANAITGYFKTITPNIETRAFLSFNTSGLSFINSGAIVINSAVLSFNVDNIDNQNFNGDPCFYGSWNFTLRNGTFIGSSLDATDYNKGTDFTTGIFDNIQRYNVNLNNPIAMINNTGDTDFVIRPNFNDPAGCDANIFISTSEATGENKPYLNITYYNGYNLYYDANGNLIQGFGKYFEYNSFNQLIRVRQTTSTGTIMAEYFYDGNGNRIKKTEVNGNGNQTIYYIGNFVQIRNSSGVFNTTYYYDRDSLVARRDNDRRIYFYHSDQLGSTSLVTNSTGDVVEYTSYNPYGEVVEGGTSRYLYTGKELDKETNFEYYGARYYYPFMAKFIQPDSIISDIHNPQALNRYAYVLNNPYKYVDPSGKFVCDAQAGCNVPYSIGNIVFTDNPVINEDDTYVKYFGITFIKSSNPQIKNQGFNELMSFFSLSAVGGADILARRSGSGLAEISTPNVAYEEALSGKRNAGLLRIYNTKANTQIEKGINSFNENIIEHQNKIANPEKYAQDWQSMTKQQREGLLKYWQKEINNYQQQRDVLQGIINRKKE